MRVAIRVSGVDLECEIPDGVDAHGEFYVRVNRDRLPPLYSYAPADFDLPATTEAAAPDADASPRDGDAKRVDWRDEPATRPVFEALKALSALADESEVKAAERTIYQVPGGDDGDEAKVINVDV
ncbi:hydroxyacylglutathione hydrolase [Aureococcus anophagefferens]|nr:hydroxyacylglutathione hydrolase [Aureococcus anophagefferens]